MHIFFRTPPRLTDVRRNDIDPASSRHHFRVAVVDDEPFQVKEVLERHGFRISEIGDLKDIGAVAEFPIVSCDIRGVGQHFQSGLEGAHLISEIKRRYPSKYVIAYSGGTFTPEFKQALDYSDVFLRRGATSDEWIRCLDAAIQACGDPVMYWKRVRESMLARDIPTFDVFLLERAYIKSINERNESHLTDAVRSRSMSDDTRRRVELLAEGLITMVRVILSVSNSSNG